jgi:hypothetical protein
MSAQVGFPVQFSSELCANVSSTVTLLLMFFSASFDAAEYDDRHCVYLSFIINCGCMFSILFFFFKLAPRKEDENRAKKKTVKKIQLNSRAN